MGIVFRKCHRNFVQYTVRIEEELLEKIRNISYKEDLSINETINQSLEYVVEEYEMENGKLI